MIEYPSGHAAYERSIYAALTNPGNGLAIARHIARRARLDGCHITDEQVSLMAQDASRNLESINQLADKAGLKADEYPKKPANCKCGFPLMMARNMCGHKESCPCYAEWLMAAFLTKEHVFSELHSIGHGAFSRGCTGCDNYFKHASFPAEHAFRLVHPSEYPNNPDGAEPFDCWNKYQGRVHCEVMLDPQHELRVSYLCDGCGWYMQEHAVNFQVVDGRIKIIYRQDREPVFQIRLPIPMPWKDLRGWSIVGMNHYFVEGAKKVRHLFVAMVNREGRCIKAEGPDESAVFEDLQKKASAA